MSNINLKIEVSKETLAILDSYVKGLGYASVEVYLGKQVDIDIAQVVKSVFDKKNAALSVDEMAKKSA